LIIITLVTHGLNEPSVSDRTFLAPTSSKPLGGKTLADRLAARAVPVQVTGDLANAPMRARTSPPTTVFIPEPSLEIEQLTALLYLPAGTRVILVEPSNTDLNAARLSLDQGATRWATKVEPPGCAMTEAASAGPAAVRHSQYHGTEIVPTNSCYNQALLQFPWRGLDMVIVGSADIFRNDRIGEHANSELALNLLTAAGGPVLWIDGHQVSPTKVIAPADGDQVGDGPNGEDQTPAEPSVFPPWLWPMLLGLSLAFIVFALWRGRRLGAPVAEPLPILVSSTETVRGRGRLYRRISARDKALAALRTGVLDRLRAALHLPGDSQPEAVVAAVAGCTGLSPAAVFDLLYGGAPGDDPELARYVAGLDSIEHAVNRAPAGGTGSGAKKGESW
jgi:hypothetical protein